MWLERHQRREVACYLSWFEEFRVHQGLRGQTPKEVYEGTVAVKAPKPDVAAIPRRELIVRFHEGRRQLPIIELKKAA